MPPVDSLNLEKVSGTVSRMIMHETVPDTFSSLTGAFPDTFSSPFLSLWVTPLLFPAIAVPQSISACTRYPVTRLR
jgi:hypothetical protein